MRNHSALLALTLFMICAHASFQGYAQTQPGSQAIDTTIHILTDISGCGVSDSVFFQATGDRHGNPLFWSLTIKDCRGALLFFHSACACEADAFFESEEYVLRQSYAGTKRDWFFNDLPERVITTRRFSLASGIFDRNNSGSVYRAARDYLVEKFGLPVAKAIELTEALALKMMKEEVTLLTVYKNPSEYGDPLIYLKEIRQFVPIGHW
ncbi:MAG: hypothetical protein NTU47_05395 [Ignavibacteriales bacterium]|nr:hypothetical protein [Ignavibacteriales bacterium]